LYVGGFFRVQVREQFRCDCEQGTVKDFFDEKCEEATRSKNIKYDDRGMYFHLALLTNKQPKKGVSDDD